MCPSMSYRSFIPLHFGTSYMAYHPYKLYRFCGNRGVKREQICLAWFFVPFVVSLHYFVCTGCDFRLHSVTISSALLLLSSALSTADPSQKKRSFTKLR